LVLSKPCKCIDYDIYTVGKKLFVGGWRVSPGLGRVAADDRAVFSDLGFAGTQTQLTNYH